MTSKPLRSRNALHGLGLVLLACAGICALLLPKLFALIDQQKEVQQSQQNIDRFVERLHKPLPTESASQYAFFIHPMPNDIDEDLLANSLQSKITQLIRTRDVRLRELKRVDTSSVSVDGLNSLNFRLEAEGDFIAITNILDQFGTMPEPFLISDLKLTPLPANDRLDTRLRITVTLSLLLQAEKKS